MEIAYPFSGQEYTQRLVKTQELMALKRLSVMVAFSSYQEREGHVAYLSNYRNSFPNAMTHQGWGYAALVIPAEGLPILVAPGRYEAKKVAGIRCACTGDMLVPEIGSAFKLLGIDSGSVGLAGLDILPTEYYLQMQQLLPNLRFENANEMLESQRMIKSIEEINILRQAAQIADAGIKAGLEAIRPGISGVEIESIVRAAAMTAGADSISQVRVASGNQVDPLIFPPVAKREVKEGEFVYLELAGWFKGYGFLCSRAAVAGQATQEQREFLVHLAEATEWMTGALLPEKTIGFYYTESRGRAITAHGHGIGLEFYELPWITIKTPLNLKTGMVLCIGPVVSAPVFGKMAFKNMVLITEDGAEVLNRLGHG